MITKIKNFVKWVFGSEENLDNDLLYMVIYHNQCRKTLDVALVSWDKKEDYYLTSDRGFRSRENALAYAKELSSRYGIPLKKGLE